MTKANVSRYNARKRKAFVEDVSVRKLAQIQNWRCWLCDGKISKTAKAPHPDSLSLDHLVPLSCGGQHSYYNCAAAHLRCNSIKSNNAVNEQLKLPIPGLIA
jgi:5-methylcytosine-specific restriction endonuclease McrA